MHATPRRTRRPGATARTIPKAALAVGFLALTAAILLAHRAPTRGYEPSIYAATPLPVWIAVGVALAAATLVASTSPPEPIRTAALLLGGGTILSVAALPIIRGYYFAGAGDSLTHLGWVRGIVRGTFDPFALFYPAIHLIGIEIHGVTGVSLTTGLMLMVVYFLAVFLLAVPLAVRAVTPDRAAVTFAALASWLVLPVDHVGVVFVTYPTLQALCFLPLVLFACICYLRRSGGESALPLGVSPFGALLALVGVGILLVHPQQAANVLVLFGIVSTLQFVARRWRPDAVLARTRPIYAQTVLLAVVFVAWTSRREKFRGTVRGMIRGALIPNVGSLSEIGQRSGSLQRFGASIGELFVKLYLVEATFALLVAVLVLLVWLDRIDERPDTRAIVSYFGAALVALTGMFVLYFATTPTYGFRQVGTLMVFATVLGGIALAHLDAGLRSLLSPVAGRSLVTVLFAAMLVLSMATMFPSPFIYKPSTQVTESRVEGHAFALSHRGEGMYYSHVALSDPMYRYGDVVYGVPRSHETDYSGTRSGVVAPSVFNEGRIPAAYARPRYFKVTRGDYEREVKMYHEFRYTARGFRRLDSTRGLDKVEANGPFHLYVIKGGAF
ncbi:MAG: hypothetical protein ABEJ30_05955 [Halorientalis sp.]